MKKLLSFCLTIILLLTITSPAYATDLTQDTTIVIPHTMVGYAISNDGTICELTGNLIETPSAYTTSDICSATYAYDVSKVTTADSPDSGYASHVYLTVYYKVRDGVYYLLTKVSGYWEIQDYNASVTSSHVDYICGHTRYQKDVSNNFSFNTGFTDFTVSDSFATTVGATLHLTYQMGDSRTWTFSLPNTVYG